jgi:hypothetical protein
MGRRKRNAVRDQLHMLKIPFPSPLLRASNSSYIKGPTGSHLFCFHWSISLTCADVTVSARMESANRNHTSNLNREVFDINNY